MVNRRSRLRFLRAALEKARIELYEAVERAGGDQTAPEVLEVAQRFDRLLVAYMKGKIHGRA